METTTLSLILSIALGTIVLFFGLRLFWLYVGIMGFAIGFVIGEALTTGSSWWLQVVIACVFGVGLSILAILLQKPAAAIAGFIALGMTAVVLVSVFATPAEWVLWVILAVAGLLGAVLAWALFTPAVIILTSLSGAAGILNAVNSRWEMNDILFLVFWAVLATLGIIVQVMTRRSDSVESQLTGSMAGAPPGSL
jgi:hypothetical protein